MEEGLERGRSSQASWPVLAVRDAAGALAAEKGAGERQAAVGQWAAEDADNTAVPAGKAAVVAVVVVSEPGAPAVAVVAVAGTTPAGEGLGRRGAASARSAGVPAGV